MPDHSVTACFDRVQETTATTGTGSVSLAGAVSGVTGFSDVLSDTNTTYYTLVSGNETDWESGLGTFASSGDILARTTVLANSAGSTAKINLTGTSTVFCSYPAGEAIHGIGSGGKMVQTSAQTMSTGALTQLEFDSTAAPGFAAVSSAVTLDTANDKITLTKKGLYLITGMASATDDDAMGACKFWLTLGTGTGLTDQFTVSVHEDSSQDVAYGVISSVYYCATPSDDIYFCMYPDAGGGSSGFTTSISTARYKPKFSAVYIR